MAGNCVALMKILRNTCRNAIVQFGIHSIALREKKRWNPNKYQKSQQKIEIIQHKIATILNWFEHVIVYYFDLIQSALDLFLFILFCFCYSISNRITWIDIWFEYIFLYWRRFHAWYRFVCLHIWWILINLCGFTLFLLEFKLIWVTFYMPFLIHWQIYQNFKERKREKYKSLNHLQ